MTILRSGSSAKYAEGWEAAFGKRKAATVSKSAQKAAAPKTSPTKSRARKAAASRPTVGRPATKRQPGRKRKTGK